MIHPIKSNYLIIDASGYIYRAFHALPDLRTADNRPTGAIFGFVKMLQGLLIRFKPEKTVVVYDPKGGYSWRNDLYGDYKANRQNMPDDLVSQIQPIKAIVDAMGLPSLERLGFEADDIIASLASQSNQATYIASSDKDLMQLVTDRVFMVNTMNDKIIDADGVVEKFGVKPNQIGDYLALVGDSVDNVPGIPKVGPKTAAKWLNQYGSLDAVVAHQDAITGKVGENLRANSEQLPLSRKLVSLSTDMDLAWDEIEAKDSDPKALYDLFIDFNFRRMAKDQAALLDEMNIQPNLADSKEVISLSDTTELMKLLDQNEFVCIDMLMHENEGISIGFGFEGGHYVVECSLQEASDKWLHCLKEPLITQKILVIGHDLKSLIKLLKPKTFVDHLFDTMLVAYLLESHHGQYALDVVYARYMHQTINIESMSGRLQAMIKLYPELNTQLNGQKALKTVYDKVELPTMQVLAMMEDTGVLVDETILEKQSKDLDKKIQVLEQNVFQAAGYEFNLASPKQLQEVLYDNLKLPILQKTPKGQPSTSESALEQLSNDFTIVADILEHRSYAKLKNTYTDKLPQLISHDTQRIHCQFNQAVTSTGRLSSSDPNLQNIPIRTAMGKRIREAFVAQPDYQLVCADYSQIELRIMAHFSEDPKLLDAFNQGQDIHTATAQEVFGVEDVTEEHRRQAKAINFGLIYGMSSFGLANQIGVSRKMAQEYIDVYFKRYPKVHEFMESTREKATEKGYVETILGRKLYVQGIKDRNFSRRQAAQRAAINAPMQGSAADLIKLAMIEIARSEKYRLVLQVHDELVYEVQQGESTAAKEEIKHMMEQVLKLRIPLIVNVGVGPNWLATK